jgi:integrase
MPESHDILNGKVHVYRRPESAVWQCSTYLGEKNHRKSTGQTELAAALAFAQDWYIERYAQERVRQREAQAAAEARPKRRAGATAVEAAPPPIANAPPPRPGVKSFRQVAAVFVREFEVMTAGERNAAYVAQKGQIVERVLNPFFGDTDIRDVSAGMISEYRMHRLEPPAEPAKGGPPEHVWRAGKYVRKPRRRWVRPARNTLHIEIVCLRQVLKTAARHGWIESLPDMSTPYKKSGKVGHRAWFSPEEYKQLYIATRERMRHPKKERWRPECEKLHDWVLFMVNTGLRPDEAKRLEDRDIAVVSDAATGERILEIEVRGKRGVGYCKSMPGAVTPYLRHRKRVGLAPTDRVWGEVQRELFNAVLTELDLKTDRDGKSRTAYSLRHTYICLRLLEGADIYQVAKNCRTSVEMIEKHYAIHLKDTLDAAAINVRRARPRAG